MPAATLKLDRAALARQYRAVRAETERRVRTLSPEDCIIQSMADASPVKWHLAHTTWFFETFVLTAAGDEAAFDPAYRYLFNSYYESVGPRHPRPHRGLVSRPGMAEVLAYRLAVDLRMEKILAEAGDAVLEKLAPVLEIGLHHEQQHQELIVTDVLHAFSQNPVLPAYDPGWQLDHSKTESDWHTFESGVRWIGHEGDGYAFDNEGPRHRVWVEAFRIANRLTTNAEYLEFIADRGYERPEFWLSDGWAERANQNWMSPLYWQRDDAGWQQFGPAGLQPLDPAEPVRHISFYEADAFARWAGGRLPTELEWETASAVLDQRDDCVWQWTASPYVAYPGYRPAAGALGEYNGKFMCNQIVLRGGSFATPAGHTRPTYRNFFAPDKRWQFAGLRLASDR